jgi:hypothetical protein
MRVGPGREEIMLYYKTLTIAFCLLFFANVPSLWAGGGGGISVQGGGTSILTGGGPGTAPIITKLGISFENGSGNFDCLALMPTPPAGTQGSGIFDKNIMYVTGPATVAGVGAGTNKPFTVTADRGGPGTKVVLVVSGLTFVETLLEGSITFPGED